MKYANTLKWAWWAAFRIANSDPRDHPNYGKNWRLHPEICPMCAAQADSWLALIPDIKI